MNEEYLLNPKNKIKFLDKQIKKMLFWCHKNEKRNDNGT